MTSGRQSTVDNPAAEISEDDRTRILPPDRFPIHSAAWYIRAFWWHHPRLREFWYELHSCYQRIWLLYKRGPVYPLDMGTEYLTATDGRLVLNTTTQARIRDMQTEFQEHQFPSPFAEQQYMRGWRRGWEHCARTHGQISEETLQDRSRSQSASLAHA